MDGRFEKLDQHFINMSQQQTGKMRGIYNSISSYLVSYDYSSNRIPLVTIVIPVNGRKSHLIQSLSCLVKQVNNLKSKTKNVQIVVSEMNTKPEHKKICEEMGVSYIHTACQLFSKSIAMNQAARILPSESFIFYDVDLVTDDFWLETCIQSIAEQFQAGSNCWISQPIPGRKILYVNEENTKDIFEQKKGIKDIALEEHKIQPSWYQGNYPPGGVILISANLLYAVQGYDYALFWDYSPEDLSFLKNACSLSDTGALLSWSSSLANCNVYHLYHNEAHNNNMSYEHMIFADSVMDGLGMRGFYLHDKLRWELFDKWTDSDPNRFPKHIFAEAQAAFDESTNHEDFASRLDAVVNVSPELVNINPAMLKSYKSVIEYFKENPQFFKLYRV